jgi:transposase
VFAAQRIHGDDTTVPVLAKVKTKTARLWTYVRDDRPFGGADPPAAVYFYSPDRAGAHPEQHLAGYARILQADAYSGFNALCQAQRRRSASLARRRAGSDCRSQDQRSRRAATLELAPRPD